MKDIYVTRPHLPPLEEFLPYLEEIWKSRNLTNGGPFHQQLEAALCEYLRVPHVSLFANGTLALITALQALRVTGEVITTPYSFVATSHSLLWHGNKPVFVDIEPRTFNLDPERIEAAITSQTTAIMPVHCYGNPCDVSAIQKIADNYNLRLIYDAAHAFGVDNDGGSLLNHGDLSVLSFHATKVFNTFEGGAIVCQDLKTKQRVDHLKNFGFVDEVTVVAPGINAKMNEFSAAVGLVQLRHIDKTIRQRESIATRYLEELQSVNGLKLPSTGLSSRPNYAYFPILVEDYSLTRDQLYQLLRREGIYARRYFYPLISDFPMYRGLPTASRANLPVAAHAADHVLCLPLYPTLTAEEQSRVIGVITDNA